MIVDPCDVCEESIGVPSLPHGTLLASYGYTSHRPSYTPLVDPASLTTSTPFHQYTLSEQNPVRPPTGVYDQV